MDNYQIAYRELRGKLLVKADGKGIFPYRKIAKYVQQFIQGTWSVPGKSGLTPPDLITTIMKADPSIRKRFRDTISELSIKYEVDENLMDEYASKLFYKFVYLPTMAEAIVYHLCKKNNDYFCYEISDEEDWNAKVDVKPVHKRKGRMIPIQVKTYPIDHSSQYIIAEKETQTEKLGIHAQYLEVIFSEDYKKQRMIIWHKEDGTKVSVDFTGSYARSQKYATEFKELILDEMLKEVEAYYQRKDTEYLVF